MSTYQEVDDPRLVALCDVQDPQRTNTAFDSSPAAERSA